MSNNLEKSVGKPVVIIDLATGNIAHGVLSAVSERGPNKQTFFSITQSDPIDPVVHTRYTRVMDRVEFSVETVLK